MEFGVSHRVDCGSNVVGLSLAAVHPAADANLLVTTTESRVSVHAPDDLRLLASWLTRPGSYNRFTTAAVQNRITRRFFCVQNGNRLFSWNERDGSLDAATKVRLRDDAFKLHVSRKLLPLVVVGKTGSVSLFNDNMEEIASHPAPDAGEGEAASGCVTTWSRLTATPPGSDSRFLLMVLKQHSGTGQGAEAASAGSSSAASSAPATRRGKAKAAAPAPVEAAKPAPPPPTLYCFVVTAHRPGAGAQGSAAGAAAGHASSGVGAEMASPAGARSAAGAGVGAAAGAGSSGSSAVTPGFVGRDRKAGGGNSASGAGAAAGSSAAGAGSSSSAASGASSAAAAASSAATVYTIKLAAAHKLTPPAGNTSGRLLSITFHKHLLSLSLLWSGGALQTLGFPRAAGAIVTGRHAWFAQSPQLQQAHQLASFVPSAPASSPASAIRDCASFALEPSCWVLAGAVGSGGAADGGVCGLSVWDVRYGILLDSKAISAVGEDVAVAATLAAPAGKASASAAAAAEDSDSETEDAAARAAAASAALAGTDPADVFQVIVSEDNSFVAVASRRRVLVTAVAVRGASLVSAIGRMAQTRSMLAADPSNPAEVVLNAAIRPLTVSAAPVLSLRACLSAAGAAARPGADAAAALSSSSLLLAGTSAPADAALAAWGAAVDASRARTRSAAAAIDDEASTPSTADVLGALAEHGVLASSAAAPSPASPAVVLAAVTRCVRHIMAASTSGGAASGFDPETVLRALLSGRHVSAAVCPHLLPCLLAAAAAAPPAASSAGTPATTAGRKRGRAASEGAATSAGPLAPDAALRLLCLALRHVRDIPEALLIRVFSVAVHHVRASDLAALWQQATAGAPVASSEAAAKAPPAKRARKGTEAAAAGDAAAAVAAPVPASPSSSYLGLLHVLGLVVRAPRNDVFLEQALQTLPADDVVLLLSALRVLLHCHTSFPQVAAATSSSSDGGAALPSPGEVLDWVRMTLDAHFTRLVLAAKAPGNGALRELLRELAGAVTAEAATCDAAALLRGQVLHVLGRGALPEPPAPDHIVEYVDL